MSNYVFYLVNEIFHFVDIPGYGYAKVSKTDREKFGIMIEDYLLNNTKLETASSSRHQFGQLYKENGELFFKLNLQIRFVK